MVIAPCAEGFQELHKFWWGYAIALGAIILLWLAKELIDFFAVLSCNRRSADSLKVGLHTSLQRLREDFFLACVGPVWALSCITAPLRLGIQRLTSFRFRRTALLVQPAVLSALTLPHHCITCLPHHPVTWLPHHRIKWLPHHRRKHSLCASLPCSRLGPSTAASRRYSSSRTGPFRGRPPTTESVCPSQTATTAPRVSSRAAMLTRPTARLQSSFSRCRWACWYDARGPAALPSSRNLCCRGLQDTFVPSPIVMWPRRELSWPLNISASACRIRF